MTRGDSFAYPPRGLSREEAARYIGVGTTKFDELVKAGRMPKPDLSLGVEYDHYILDANSKDNSLENCKAVCPKCHHWKTRNRDTPTAAKTVRQQLMGMKTKPKSGFPSPGPKSKESRHPQLEPKRLFREVAR